MVGLISVHFGLFEDPFLGGGGGRPRKKIKCVGGASGIFSSPSPLRFSNGIAPRRTDDKDS